MGSAASRTPAKSLSRAQTNSALGEALVTNNANITAQPFLPALPSLQTSSDPIRLSPEVLAAARPAPLHIESKYESQPSTRSCLYEGTLLATKAVSDDDGRPRAIAHVQLVVAWPAELFQAAKGELGACPPGQRQATVVALRVDRLPASLGPSDPKPPIACGTPKPCSPPAPQSPAELTQSQLVSQPSQRQELLQEQLPPLSLPPGLEPGCSLRCSGAAPQAPPCNPCHTSPSTRRAPTGCTSMRNPPQRTDTAYGGGEGLPSASSSQPSRTTTPSPMRTPALPPIAPAAAAATAAAAAATTITTAAAAGLRAGGLFLHAGQWSGIARDGPSGGLRFRSCAPPGAVEPPEAGPQALSLELLPQPHLFHFALVYRHDEAAGLRDELLAQMAAMSRDSRPLRVWDIVASAATSAAPPSTPMAAAAAGGGAGGSPASAPRPIKVPTSRIGSPLIPTSAQSSRAVRLSASRRSVGAAASGGGGAFGSRSSGSVSCDESPASGGGGSGSGGDGSSPAAVNSAVARGVTLVVGAGAGGAAGLSAAANLVVLLSPGMWECEEVVSALRQARSTASTSSSSPLVSSSSVARRSSGGTGGSGSNSVMAMVNGMYGVGGVSGCNGGGGSGGGGGGSVLLLFIAAADAFGGCHVPTPCSPASPVSELLTIASRVAVDLNKMMESVPSDLAWLFDEVEAIPYRLHPHAAAAAVRHIVEMGGCGARLDREVAASELEAYLTPLPSDAPLPRPYRRAGVAARQPPTYCYEGVALRNSDGAPGGGAKAPAAPTLRGWFQASVTFDAAASQIRMEVSYEPRISQSMPSYSQIVTLHWQPDGVHGGGGGAGGGGGGGASAGGSVMQIGEVTPGNYRGRWEGRVAAVGGEMRLTEGQDDLLFRPQPFHFHFYIAGAPDVASAGLAGLLASGLQQESNPARRVRLYDSCGRPQDERHAAMDCSGAVLAVLSCGAWSDGAFCADIKRAAALGRRVLFMYDPDPRMPCHVDPQSAVRGAPPGVISALLAASDVYPYYRRWYEQDACLRQLLRAAGFDRCVRLPTDNDKFLYELRESRSDLASLAILRERRWVYYEGVAERAGCIWGWYQIDAKFKPELDLVELWVEFESRHPGSIPSYRSVNLLDWTRSNNTVAEREGRWKGRVGGMAGTFSLVNCFGDSLRFTPQPYIWHYFLSHIQRETSDACALLATRLAELSVQGRRMRCWFDNRAGAVNREAMALGVAHSQHFLLVLSPSAFESAYVRFEIQTALLLHKSTLVLYDSDPTSRTYVDVTHARAAAPPELRPLFDGPCLPWPGLRGGDADVDEFVRQVMEVSGFSDLYCGRHGKEASSSAAAAPPGTGS